MRICNLPVDDWKLPSANFPGIIKDPCPLRSVVCGKMVSVFGQSLTFEKVTKERSRIDAGKLVHISEKNDFHQTRVVLHYSE